MRYAERNRKIFSLCIAAVMACVGVKGVLTLDPSTRVYAASILEELISKDIGYNVGYDYGAILTIDGREAASEYTYEGETRLTAKTDYSTVIGSTGGGLICELEGILRASDREANRRMCTGDTIVTTLHSKGTEAANAELSVFGEDVLAGITVVLRDGAVLVDTSSRLYEPDCFFQPDKYPELYVDCNTSNMLAKGSSFKPLVVRMLLEHEGELAPELTLHGTFQDVSCVGIGGGDILYNYDGKLPEHYETDEGGGVYSREVDLSAMMQASSNTGIVRRVQDIGLEQSLTYMQELYHLNGCLNTEICSLSMGEIDSERLAYYFYGQDSYLSGIQLCQLFSYAFSGEFYCPFYVARVQDPDGNVIYQANPMADAEYRLDVQPENDILKEALCDCFEAYTGNGLYAEFGELLRSRRILTKSGTSENDDGTENRIMMMTILSEDGTEVLASACIHVNGTSDGISNAVLVEKLLRTAEAVGLI